MSRPPLILRCEKLGICSKLGLGKRIRLTCVDASRDLLAFGTNTGSIYIYSRDGAGGLQFLRMIAGNPDARTPEAVVMLRLK